MRTRWGLIVLLCLQGVAHADPPDDFGVACLDARTGAVRWQTAVAKGWPPRLRLDGASLWVERAARWHRLELATGKLQGEGTPPAETSAPDTGFWTTNDAILHDKDGQTGTVVTTSAYVDDLAVAGETLAYTLDKDDGQVYGFDLASGHLRWVLRPRDRVSHFEVGDGSRVELLGDRLLVYAPSSLLALDPDTGAVAWQTEVPALAGRWGTLRAIALGHTWVVSVDGEVVAVDSDSGTVRWSWDAGDGAATVLAAGGGAICVDRRDARFEPFTPDDAERARELEVDTAGAQVTLTWIERDQVPDGATRVPLAELRTTSKGPRLTLSDGDATRTIDVSSITKSDGSVYLDVPGTWENAAFSR